MPTAVAAAVVPPFHTESSAPTTPIAVPAKLTLTAVASASAVRTPAAAFSIRSFPAPVAMPAERASAVPVATAAATPNTDTVAVVATVVASEVAAIEPPFATRSAPSPVATPWASASALVPPFQLPLPAAATPPKLNPIDAETACELAAAVRAPVFVRSSSSATAATAPSAPVLIAVADDRLVDWAAAAATPNTVTATAPSTVVAFDVATT